MDVRIEIAFSEAVGRWSWEASVDGASCYGYEDGYGEAEDAARHAAGRMGAWDTSATHASAL